MTSQTATTPDDEPLTIPAAARAALDAAGGDVVRGTEIFTGWIMKDPTLYRPLMDPLVKSAAYQAIRSQCKQTRRALWMTEQPTAENQRGRVIALAGATMNTLLDFPLPGGMRLADAHRDDVVAAAEFYRKQSTDMGFKAKWLQLIAQHITGKKKVSQVMNDARLAELREEAIRE